MITFSGRRVTINNNVAPSISDIAIHLGRLCRYAGGCRVFYSVLLHSKLVADICPPDIELECLVHDSTEAVHNDIPRGFKIDAMKELEHKILLRIFRETLGIKFDSDRYARVKEFDERALWAEAYVLGPSGLVEFMRPKYIATDVYALRKLLDDYRPMDCIDPAGRAVGDYISRLYQLLQIRRAEECDTVLQAPEEEIIA